MHATLERLTDVQTDPLAQLRSCRFAQSLVEPGTLQPRGGLSNRPPLCRPTWNPTRYVQCGSPLVCLLISVVCVGHLSIYLSGILHVGFGSALLHFVAGIATISGLDMFEMHSYALALHDTTVCTTA
jgi:hypothetical protein